MGASDWCICNQKEVELWMDVDYEKETTAGTGEEWGGWICFISSQHLWSDPHSRLPEGCAAVAVSWSAGQSRQGWRLAAALIFPAIQRVTATHVSAETN